MSHCLLPACLFVTVSWSVYFHANWLDARLAQCHYCMCHAVSMAASSLCLQVCPHECHTVSLSACLHVIVSPLPLLQSLYVSGAVSRGLCIPYCPDLCFLTVSLSRHLLPCLPQRLYDAGAVLRGRLGSLESADKAMRNHLETQRAELTDQLAHQVTPICHPHI